RALILTPMRGPESAPQGVYFAGNGAPSRISSVARRTTLSPACRLPMTSMLSPSAAPFFTSTHSALPLRSRTTKVRSAVVTTLVLGTSSDGRVLRTGHFTLGYMPGERRSEEHTSELQSLT